MGKDTWKKTLFFSFLLLFFPLISKTVQAHCPLCTVGAIAAAGGAAYLGVNTIIVGVFIGAFAMSLGFWIARSIKKKYVPHQNLIIILLIFLTTIIPIFPIVKDITPINVWITGGYGTWLNRTYIINNVLLGSLLGGLVVPLTPLLSRKITKARNGKNFSFQGTILTLLILIILGGIIQLII